MVPWYSLKNISCKKVKLSKNLYYIIYSAYIGVINVYKEHCHINLPLYKFILYVNIDFFSVNNLMSERLESSTTETISAKLI